MRSTFLLFSIRIPGADPGFPMGGGRGPPTLVLCGENVCENERIGSRSGGVRRKNLYADPPMDTVRDCDYPSSQPYRPYKYVHFQWRN